jgi:glycosyltransferase involved in cell wall biosynthesis
MRIAFHAPLKSPLHPVPSGDRLLARAFLAALGRAGHDVTLASRLRSYDRTGDEARQQRIQRIGAGFARRLIRRWERSPGQRPDLWFTYHVYHKAPDVIGPQVSAALGIPYVVAEASIASKQRNGPWRVGYEAALAAIRTADAVLCINPADVEGVRTVRADVAQLPPFFDVDAFLGQRAPRPDAAQREPRHLIVAAMMRRGNKLASFQLLADALSRMEHVRWQLVIVGDGEAMQDVRAAFAPFAEGRVRFEGVVAHDAMPALLQAADLFVWPAVDEVFGMGLLEAQACGVPVVAGWGPGVAAVVAEGVGGVLVPQGDAAAFAIATERLLADAERLRAMAFHAQGYVRANHDITAAARTIDATLHRVVRRRRQASAQ